MQITKEEVKQILEKVKACVHNDKFRISLNPNRIENQSFINDYRLTTKQQKRMILELDIYDFSKIDIDRKNKIQIIGLKKVNMERYIIAPIYKLL